MLHSHTQQRRQFLREYALGALEEGYEYFAKNCLEGDVGDTAQGLQNCEPSIMQRILNTLGMNPLKEEVRALQALKCCTPETD